MKQHGGAGEGTRHGRAPLAPKPSREALSSRRLAAIVDLCPLAILSADAEREILHWNLGARDLLGYAADEAIGKPLPSIFPPEARPALDALIARVFAGERLEGVVTALSARDGRVVPVSLSAAPVLEDERPIGITLIARDLTAQREAEEAVRRKTEELERSNRELQQFAYAASHDLMEPLRKVTAFGDLLRKRSGAALDEIALDFLARMQDAAARMARLIEDLLQYSRLLGDARPFERVELATTVRLVLADLEARIAETGATVEVGELPVLRAHPFQMRQLFQNLIANALKFRRPGTAPRVSVTAAPAADGFVSVTVADDGIGFEERFAERIFQPFVRLHTRSEYEGTGMGLAICRRILLRHGGWIAAKGEPGRGAAFTVTLPLGRRP